jgi:hypothetical protein
MNEEVKKHFGKVVKKQVWRNRKWVDLVGVKVKAGERLRTIDADGNPEPPFDTGFVVVVQESAGGEADFILTADFRGNIENLTDEQRFRLQAHEVFRLCERYNLPVPKIEIVTVTPDTPCDVARVDYIGFNLAAAKDTNPYDHAHQVFGHWLCNLEQTVHSDKIADLIMEWVRQDDDNEMGN